MPSPGMAWRHVVISTHNRWLPGDPRGFRARDHKIHSSGDYKNPPPEGEHAGLYEYSKRISGDSVVIPVHLREEVGRAILGELAKQEFQVLAIAVCGQHAHLLVELPDDKKVVRQIVGRCKTSACYALREQMPGTVWGRYGSYDRIKDAQHQRNTYYYILRQEGAWVWSFREEAPDTVQS